MGNHESGFISSQESQKSGIKPDLKGKKSSIYLSEVHKKLYGVNKLSEFDKNAFARVPKTNQVKMIESLFKYKKKLGEGASCRVLLAYHRKKKQLFALKELRRQKKHHHNSASFMRELVILETLKHDHILELDDVYMDKCAFYISTKYYSGGCLLQKIITSGKFTEKKAVVYIKQILDAVAFMHSRLIVHRDLKPNNMVFSKKKGGVLKIIDFGDSEIVIDDEIYPHERVGTIQFVPPEWKHRRRGDIIKKGDIWSIGVITYCLMTGNLPFISWEEINQYDGNLTFYKSKGKKAKLSNACINFIETLMAKNPKHRPTAVKAMKHEWLTGGKASDEDLGDEHRANVKEYDEVNKVAKIVAKGNLNELDKDELGLLSSRVQNKNDVHKFLKHYEASMRPDNNQHQYDKSYVDIRTMHVLASIRGGNGNKKSKHNGHHHQNIPQQHQQQKQYPNNGASYNNNKMRGKNIKKPSFNEQKQIYDENIVKQLLQMGVGSRNACIRATLSVGNMSVHMAAEWLFRHMGNPKINDPIEFLEETKKRENKIVSNDNIIPEDEEVENNVNNDDIAAPANGYDNEFNNDDDGDGKNDAGDDINYNDSDNDVINNDYNNNNGYNNYNNNNIQINGGNNKMNMNMNMNGNHHHHNYNYNNNGYNNNNNNNNGYSVNSQYDSNIKPSNVKRYSKKDIDRANDKVLDIFIGDNMHSQSQQNNINGH